MAHRNYPYTQGEDNQIRAAIESFNGCKIPANVYKSLASTMGNRHTVASLMSRASRLRNGRKYSPAPEKRTPCDCDCKHTSVPKQENLELYNSSELIREVRETTIRLDDLLTRIMERIIDEVTSAACIEKQRQRIVELEAIIQNIATATASGIGGQA